MTLGRNRHLVRHGGAVALGAGSRVKVAEAFSRRCPVVSTPVGVYGYNVENERELLIADSVMSWPTHASG